MNQKPQLTKPIKISNVGPFNEDGIQIDFGAKQNPNKANIHILVGENGCGKSTVLKTLFFSSYQNRRSLIDGGGSDNACFFKGLESNNFEKEYPNSMPTFYYTPSEPFIKYTEHHYLPKNQEQGHNFIKNWVCYFPTTSYLKYIETLESNRDKLFRKDIDQKIIQDIKIQIKLTEKIEWFIKQVYEINFCYKLKSLDEGYQPYFEGKYIKFNQFSTGYRQIISLITDILIKVWSIESDLEDKSQGQFVLLLDEIDVHLHPKAQRRILPALQSMFPNSEIFCTTHSPFVVNSVDDAWVYEIEKGVKILEGRLTSSSESYDSVLTEDFDVSSRFGNETQDLLNTFYDSIEQGKENSKIIEQLIAKESPEIDAIISYHLQSLSMAKYGKNK